MQGKNEGDKIKMFGILTYIKIGAAVVIIAVAGYFVWNYKHMQTKIAGLEQKVAGLELQAEVVKKAQEATDKTVKAMQARSRKNVQVQTEIDKAVESGNTSAVDKLWLDRGMFSPRSSAPKGGAASPPGNLPAR